MDTRGAAARFVWKHHDISDYELRYLTGEGYKTLGKVSLRNAWRRRREVAGRRDSAQPATFGAVEFVPTRPAACCNARRRASDRVAKSALIGLTEALPPNSGFALRVFGHKEADLSNRSRDQTGEGRKPAALRRSKPSPL
jgi:hypothetical protein